MKTEFETREALIPMVGGKLLGTLCRIAADGELPPAHPAQLDRALSELLESGLYQAGQQAKAAAHMFKLPRSGWLRATTVALHVVNPGDVVGLAAENATSAELGLALAMLMYRGQTDERCVL